MGVDMEKSFKSFNFSLLLNAHFWEPHEEVALLGHKKLTLNQVNYFILLWYYLYVLNKVEIDVKNEYV